MIRLAPYLCGIVLLSSCGGGGGGSTPTSIPNRAPVITDPGILSVREGVSDVVSLSATDADGNSLSFSILSGDDQSLFKITSSGVLSFASVPDFESPGDADIDNTYLLTVQVTDGSLNDSQSLTVTVTDAFQGRVVDAPITGALVFVDLNSNNQKDPDEPSGATDANGYFNVATFTSSQSGGARVISKGGTDAKTGTALPKLALVSDVPADVTQLASVTPITTLLSFASTPVIKEQVLVALGIGGTPEELLTSDEWSKAEAGDENAKANQRVNQQVGLILQTVSTLTNDGDETTDVSLALVESLAKKILAIVQAQGSIDFTLTSTIQTILSEVAQDVTPTIVIETSALSAVAASIAMINTLVSDTALDPLSVTALEIVDAAQNSLQTSVANVLSSDISVVSFTDNTSASKLFVNVEIAVDAPDNDSDGLADVLDADDDNDQVRDSIDAFPLDSTESVDTDGDGTGNNADADDDGDGVADTRDLAPLDALLTPPTATMTSDLTTGNAPLRVFFSANTSLAGNPDDSSDVITGIVWDSGDGLSGNGANFDRIYLSAGDYTVSAVVTNSDGYSHTANQIISVTELEGTLTLSGTITIPSNYFADSDVNDADSISTANGDCASAQIIPRTSVVSGYANQPGAGDPGTSKVSGDVYDVYKINANGGEVINLTSGDTSSGDLDLALGDSSCNEIDASIGDSTLYESLTIASAGVYYIEVSAWSGASTYLLEIGGRQTLASHGWNASAELVEDQLMVVESKGTSSSSVAKARQSLGLNNASKMTLPDYNGPVLYTFSNSGSVTQTLNSSASSLTSSATGFVSPAVGLGQPLNSILGNKLNTLKMAKKMRGLKQFKFVEPNFIYKASSVPNDPLYITQKWHYEQINMPKAWDRSTGAGTVKVAVIDTGVMMKHPDLVGRLTTDGYDFVSSSSGDGDGPDSDASDPGDGRDNILCPDSPDLISSFHGTHVAGTVGASGNNNKGVTGVNWNVDIMPIRVLGCSGWGNTSDIIDGILYAAGLPNRWNVSPDSPADIINLSLGGPGSSIFAEQAVSDARKAGVIVIASAGNEALEGNPLSYPASYAGVVSVGATNPDGNRAGYSQYNEQVDVTAPGGYGFSDPNATNSGRVFSTWAKINSDGSISSAHAYMNGTSMAAPHVAGVASLMKGLYPALSPTDFDAALTLGLSTRDYGTPGKDPHFGYGLIDADKALQTAEALSSGIDADFPPLLLLSNYSGDLGLTGTQIAIQAINAGGGSLTISQVSKSASNISIVAPDTTDGLGDYVITIDRTGLAEGVYQGSVEFTSDVGSRTLVINYEELTSGSSEASAGKLYTLLYNIETDTVEKQVSSVVSSGGYTFSLSDVNAGVYALITGSDIDNDLTICGAGEACAVWPSMEDPDYILANQSLAELTLNARFQSQIQGELSSSGATSGGKSTKVPYDRCGGKGTLKIPDKVTIDSCFKRVLKNNTYIQ